MPRYLKLFATSFQFIKKNKLRNILNVISISIGLSGVLIALFIGFSVKEQVVADVDTQREVMVFLTNDNFIMPAPDVEYIEKNTISTMYKEFPEIMTIESANSNELMIEGNKYTYSKTNNIDVYSGNNFINQTEDVVVVYQYEGADSIWELNEEINIEGKLYEVIGFTNSLSMDFSTFYFPEYVDILPDSSSRLTDLRIVFHDIPSESTIEKVVNRLDDFVLVEDFYYESFDFSQMVASLLNVLILIGSLFGGIILFIALIGIVNTLFISVYERSGEIAILRAMGMLKRDILILFLFESLIIVFIASAFAISTSCLVSMIILSISDINFYISIPLVIMIFLFVLIIAILAGIMPAKKASNMNISSILK